MLLMLSLIAHFWRAVATADWGRLSIVVALGVLVGFYLRSRASLFAQQSPVRLFSACPDAYAALVVEA